MPDADDKLTPADPREVVTALSLALRAGDRVRSIRMTLSLDSLAPDIVKAAVEGRLPRGFGLKRLVDLPMAWPDQWHGLGLHPHRRHAEVGAMLREALGGAQHGARDRRNAMVRKFVIAAASAAVTALSPSAFGEQTGGTADEAKAMLMKAIAAVKADKAKARDMFNKGEGGFRDRDLYVFCVNASDGTIVAVGNPKLREALGTDIRAAQNSTGKAFGAEIYAAIQKPEGQITEVSYMMPKPGADDTPLAKVGLITRADNDLGCGVGYYK
jgi:hypothetical protein